MALNYDPTPPKNTNKQHKTKQNKIKQNKTKQNKTKQNKTKQTRKRYMALHYICTYRRESVFTNRIHVRSVDKQQQNGARLAVQRSNPQSRTALDNLFHVCARRLQQRQLRLTYQRPSHTFVRQALARRRNG
jgi:hypothetical protein